MEQEQKKNGNRKLLYAVVVYVLIFAAVFLISNIKAVNTWISYVLAVLRPVIIGLVLAYVSNPFLNFFEKRLLSNIRYPYLRRTLAMILTLLLLLLFLSVIILLIVPQLVSSMQDFITNFDSNLSRLVDPVNHLIEQINDHLPRQEDGSGFFALVDDDRITEAVSNLWEYLVYLAQEEIGFSSINRLLDILSSAASGLTNVIFGVFLSVYLLFSKEKRYAQIMRFRRAFIKDTVNERITRVCTVADRSFGGFIRGKVLDSLIVGILTYVACVIFRIPYALLVAAIVGVTDFIPVIGPFIGGIPTAIIILIADPIKVIFFVISLIVIQQIDGNIIAPKILGENTGVSSLCVLVSIILMGGLWGIPGMIIGVPLFATVLELVDFWLEKRLEARGLPNEIENYYSPDMVARKTETAFERRRRKREEARKLRTAASENAGNGDLNLVERIRLRTYDLAGKYHLFSDITDEDLAKFAEEERRMMEEHTHPLDINPAEDFDDSTPDILPEDVRAEESTVEPAEADSSESETDEGKEERS